MNDAPQYRMVNIAGRPIYPLLAQFPVVCFTGALVSDIAYWRTANLIWSTFSAWLLAVGVILGIVALIIGLIDFFTDRFVRRQRAAWVYMIGSLLALVLSIFNLFVHGRDGWTAVVPTGITLSVIVFLILVFDTWVGWPSGYRYDLGLSK